MKRIHIFIIFIFLSIFFLASKSAYANGAPNALSAHNNGEIQPVNESDIKISKEELRFKNFSYSGKYATLDTNVLYQLVNTSEKSKTVEIVFPYDNPTPNLNITIRHNNKDINYTVKENIDYFDSFNVERAVPKYGWRNPKVVLFEIQVSGLEKSSLEISYTQFSGFDSDGYSFLYYLQPAKFWKDYHDLDIYITLPTNVKLNSNLKFSLINKKKESKSYLYHSDKLPDKDLYFKVRKARFNIIALIVIFAIAFSLLIFIVIKIKTRRAKNY